MLNKIINLIVNKSEMRQVKTKKNQIYYLINVTSQGLSRFNLTVSSDATHSKGGFYLYLERNKP